MLLSGELFDELSFTNLVSDLASWFVPFSAAHKNMD
jgi:hypothetical protein